MSQGRYKDLTGLRFGRLVVVEKISTRNASGRSIIKWRCKCDCGGESLTVTQNLKSGLTNSCGCFNRERTSEAKTKHGLWGTRSYNSWVAMKTRCNNPNADNYDYYGGRGIEVCPEWEYFENFYKDMGDCPDGCSIERVDNDAGYSPENCVWVTMSEQSVNRRDNSNNTSGERGVHWHSRGQVWQATIGVDNSQVHLGYFKEKEDAIKARHVAEVEYQEGLRDNVLTRLQEKQK